jgi:hypothetical protein
MGEKSLPKYISDKRLKTRIYSELKNLNSLSDPMKK